ncbi:PL29 family lyase N-terminal domain-containing protein [uncultured Bacteroides sp.]|uniref:PL29 family lyase N-terminal domain-containing protein n=1 Tax=uncultured Bacteroides sp. TaxID=162156 RepID=UPI00272B3AD9|nr:PL29 family lyase N-terminal domain-containing protein [uncultured Bacteroides sp.]
MNKKFLNVILFSALMVGSAGTFVSCKDYDDDINGLQEQIDANKKQIDDILAAINGKKFIESYTPVEGGYLLTFAGGETLTIKNGAQGAQGEKGDQGLQGIQGPKGETGATIVPKFKVDAENYWMISVDEGETYEYVLNDAGQKIKAKGADGTNVDVEEVVGNYVKVDEEGYICIGEYRTSFKYNVNIPSMIYNEKDGTMQVTIDGQSYTLLMEGSAFNGLQTIVYRKQAADDNNDYAVAYQLYYPQDETDTDTLFAAVPAKASFKVYPSKFSKSDAELFFSETYQTRAAELPKLSVLDWDFDKEQEGVIWVKMAPENLVPNYSYATSLDVKMYGQYVSASDYFNVKSQYASARDIHNVRVNAEDEIMYSQQMHSSNSWGNVKFMNQNDNDYSYKVGSFDYKGTFNLNDSIDVALNLNDGVLLADADIQYEQKFELIDENADMDLWGVTVKKGIFDAEKVAKEGILAVKEELQPSAINEYAVVKVTTTVKSQVKDVHDLVIYNYVLVQAIRPEVEQSVETIQLSPLGDATFNLGYKTSTQIVKLDVRAFETAIGGRDILTSNFGSSMVWPLHKAVYNESKELTGYELAFDRPANRPNSETWSVNVPVNPGEAFVWFKKAQGNATDSLFLFIGPKTKVEKNTFYLMWGNVKHNGIYTPYAVENRIDNKYFITTINDLAVTRSFDATVKEEYSAQTIIGKWNADKTLYTLESNSFSDMYIIKPADAVAKYKLDANKQNAYVKELMKNGQLTFDNNTYTVKFEPSVDVAKVKELKIDIYDTEVHKDNFYRTDTWTVKSPLQDFKNTANLGKHYDPTLAKGTVIKFQELAATAWKNLVLKDYIDQTIVSYKNKQLTEAANAEGLYRTKGTSTGLKFTTNTEGWTINENNELVCTIDPTGTVYTKTVTVTVSYKHDWGTTSFNFTIEVIRDVKP